MLKEKESGKLVHYLITIFNDGITEVLKMQRMDIELVYLYRFCIGNIDNKNLLIKGILFEWQDKKDDIIFLEVEDLIEKFKFLERTDLSDDYENLKEYIFYNYITKEEKTNER